MLYYDLIIVGGGLVGAGLAAALHQSNLRIALIDAKLPSNEDPRLFALNSSSCQFLKNINLWPQLVPYASAIHQVHVSHQGHFGAVRLNREEINLPELGFVIPARYIETALNEELNSLSHCTVYRPATLHSLHQQNGNVGLSIITEDGEIKLQSNIVIGADGTESTVRKLLNIPTEIFDYEQSALVARIKLNRSHGHIAYERFEANGAIAMLPLINNECAMIWTAANKTIEELRFLSDTEFVQHLQRTFGYRLGRLQDVSKRHIFPLRMVRAEKAIEQSVLLLGNSAHTLHPIAAQGFNLALFEVATLVEIINKNKTFTAEDLHHIYTQTQKQESVSIGVSHRLTGIFSSQSLLLGLAVQLGMMAFDISTPIKKRFIAKMMGRSGKIPNLLLSDTT